jgi:hypothetical protein
VKRLILVLPIILGLRCDADSWQRGKIWIPQVSEVRLVTQFGPNAGQEVSLGVFSAWNCIHGPMPMLEQAVACNISDGTLCSGRARRPESGQAFTCLGDYELADLLVTTSG